MSRVQVMLTKTEMSQVNRYLNEVGSMVFSNKGGLLNLALRRGFSNLLKLFKSDLTEYDWSKRWVYYGQATERVTLFANEDTLEDFVKVCDIFERLMHFKISESMMYRIALMEGIHSLFDYYEISI